MPRETSDPVRHGSRVQKQEVLLEVTCYVRLLPILFWDSKKGAILFYKRKGWGAAKKIGQGRKIPKSGPGLVDQGLHDNYAHGPHKGKSGTVAGITSISAVLGLSAECPSIPHIIL